MIWSIIVGGFIGFIAGAITKKGGAMGIIANIIAGLLGSSVAVSYTHLTLPTNSRV